MNTKLSLLAAACLLGAAVPAQATVSVTALTSITASVTENGIAYVQTLPAGPLASPMVLSSQAPAPSGTRARFTSDYAVSSESVLYSCGIMAAATSATASVSVSQAEVLLAISAPVTTGVAIGVTFIDQTLAGSPQPRIDVDVFDNGTIDYVNGAAITGLPVITVGPQPLHLRLIFEARASQFERSECELGIVIQPLTPVTIFRTALGCSDTLDSLIVRRSFVPEAVYFRRDAIGQSPLLAIGFSMQPTLLPPTFRPCLLVPSIDIVIPMSIQAFDIAIPQFVRPLGFHAQAVAMSMGNLVVTDAFAVSAY